MNLKRLLGVSIATVILSTSHVNAQVVLEFNNNDQYCVEYNRTKYNFNNTDDLCGWLNNVTNNHTNYDTINKELDNTIVFEGFSINTNGIVSLTMKSNRDLQQNIVLKYDNNIPIKIPRVVLKNINSLKIYSNSYDTVRSGEFNYEDIYYKKIMLNDNPILLSDGVYFRVPYDLLPTCVANVYINRIKDSISNCNIF